MKTSDSEPHLQYRSCLLAMLTHPERQLVRFMKLNTEVGQYHNVTLRANSLQIVGTQKVCQETFTLFLSVYSYLSYAGGLGGNW